ncbi:MAG: FAD-dependent oxidoreductase [Faecalibacterium sp.]|jgi:hypothetical protein|nr:FAD-dependent oxidoreductase [Faecalibacterium sp.]
MNTCAQKEHHADLCVIGGGLAGLTAGLAAARHGCRVVLMQDRPVLGGNCSSEIRMWPLGCHEGWNREAGILEELQLENLYRNPRKNYSLWDSVLFGAALQQPNLELLLNCTCQSAEMASTNRIAAVTGWQLTTYTSHRISADYFADCSGDSILSFLTGAHFRKGREGREEYGESIAPEKADACTMGMSCLLQAQQRQAPSGFIPPAWANRYPSPESFPNRPHDLTDKTFNYWWLELGGTQDTIADTETLRDELVKTALGAWDHIKNHGAHHAENWELMWAGFLPGKRESRRYVGAYTMTENDVRAEGQFSDVIAYGGWTMDDHHPEGLRYPGEPNIFHPAPSPFGIPLRCLYSENIENLGFAGRNISVTHAAMSASRVMNTCALLGQALGTAVFVAYKNGLRDFSALYPAYVPEIQQFLQEDDCYLPRHRRTVAPGCLTAKLEGAEETIRDGVDRDLPGEAHGCLLSCGQEIRYTWDGVKQIRSIRLVFDSDFARETVNSDPVLRWYPMLCNIPAGMEDFHVPATLVKNYRIFWRDAAGQWKQYRAVTNNYQRLNHYVCGLAATGLAFLPMSTWGAEKCHVFSFDFEEGPAALSQ